MAEALALDASYVAELTLLKQCQNFQASLLSVAYVAALDALHDVLFGAVPRMMAALVAPKTESLVAIERQVIVLAAKEADESLYFVWTVLGVMASLLAVAAGESGVGLGPVSGTFGVAEPIESVVARLLCVLVVLWRRGLRIRLIGGLVC